MARTLQHYLDHMTHAMGKSPDSRHVQIDTFNDAARYVFEYRMWPFRKVGPTYAPFVSDISITTADYSVVSGIHTITKTGGFTNYRFVAGDELSITAGAGVTVGSYRIRGRTSANVITLLDDPGSTSTGDVSASIRHAAISAPSDFGLLLSMGIENSGGLTGDFTRIALVTTEDMVWMRENFFEPDGGCLYICVQPAASLSSILAATPMWPVYPLPDSGSEPVVVLSYARRWVDMAIGDVAGYPPFPEPYSRALMLACRAFAVGLENQTNPAEDGALRDELSRLSVEAGSVQTDFGPIRGGVSALRYQREQVILGDVSY